MNIFNRLYYLFLTLFWGYFIFFLSSLPGSSLPSAKMDWEDMAVHFYLYFILALLLFLVLRSFLKDKVATRHLFFFSLVICALYGISDEYHQGFVLGRFPSLSDLSVDVIGSLVGNLFGLFLNRSRKPKLLLHICCVGCGVYISQLLKDQFEIILFFFNPNIFPKEEYDKRLVETRKIARKFGLKLISPDYDHDKWLLCIQGHEQDQEKGERCLICFNNRLEEAARFASANKIKYFTTTLTTSPHKDAQAIIANGKNLAGKYNLIFLDKDWKKQNGAKLASELSKKLGLYRQNYCGCEFSKRAVD